MNLTEIASEARNAARNPAIIGFTALTLTQLACKGEGILIAGVSAVALLLGGGLYLALRPDSTTRQINRMTNDAQKREDRSPYSPKTRHYLMKRGNSEEAVDSSGGDPSGLK